MRWISWLLKSLAGQLSKRIVSICIQFVFHTWACQCHGKLANVFFKINFLYFCQVQLVWNGAFWLLLYQGYHQWGSNYNTELGKQKHLIINIVIIKRGILGGWSMLILSSNLFLFYPLPPFQFTANSFSLPSVLPQIKMPPVLPYSKVAEVP